MKSQILLLTLALLLRLTPASAQWTLTNFPTDKIPSAVAVVDNYFLVGTSSGEIFRSDDQGNSWTVTTNGMTVGLITELIHDKKAGLSRIIAATDSGLFRSTDYGDNWVETDTSFREKLIRTVYQSGDSIFFSEFNRNYRSHDDGLSWREITIGQANQATNCFYRFGNELFAGIVNIDASLPGNRYIYRSADFDTSWVASDSGSKSDISSFSQLGSRYFAAGYSILRESTDGGNIWDKSVAGILVGYPITELVSFGGYVFISTFNNIYTLHESSDSAISITGNITFPSVIATDLDIDYILVGVFNFPESKYEVWRRPTADITTDIDHDRLLTGVSLSQNYPNPFSASTEIQFNLTQTGMVTLRVLNTSGQVIRTLLREVKVVGDHSAIWDGNDDAGHPAPSGIYFYQIRGDRFLEARKMLLQR